MDGFYERRSDIWVSSDGQNSAVLGASGSYVNAGIVDSWGTEIGANYYKKMGNVELNLGGTFTYNRSKIIEMLEEPGMEDQMIRLASLGLLGNFVGMLTDSRSFLSYTRHD